MCEPLIGKKEVLETEERNAYVDVFYKSDVKSAVESYKKYKHNVDLLRKEQPEIFKKYMNSMEIAEEDKKEYTEFLMASIEGNRDDWECYDDWLFDYCFSDVIG